MAKRQQRVSLHPVLREVIRARRNVERLRPGTPAERKNLALHIRRLTKLEKTIPEWCGGLFLAVSVPRAARAK